MPSFHKNHIGSMYMLFLLLLFLPLLLGGLSSFVVSYKPVPISYAPFAPPKWMFGVVWTILYLLIGLASAWVYQKKRSVTSLPMIHYWIHLLFLTLWFPLFVSFPQLRILWFSYILLLWISGMYIAYEFYRVIPRSGYILIPYLVWLLYAAYLCFFSLERQKRDKI
jgi:tryptophan-rich sensory protein